MELLNKITTRNRVLCAHVVIYGNEMADLLAEDATEMNQIGETTVSKAELKLTAPPNKPNNPGGMEHLFSLLST